MQFFCQSAGSREWRMLFSIAVFMLIYMKIEGYLGEFCKIYSTYMEGESNVNNKPVNEIFEDKTSYYC